MARLLAERHIEALPSDEADLLRRDLEIVPISTLERTAHGRRMIDAYLDSRHGTT